MLMMTYTIDYRYTTQSRTACCLTTPPLDDLRRLWRGERLASGKTGEDTEEGEPVATTANNGNYKQHLHKGLDTEDK